jgi:hypothetical protein
LLSASGALADARSDYLVRLLRDSGQFRVRAQAAISLGNVRGQPEVVDVLVEALRDTHPAVRAAAATSLGDLGDGSHVAKLRPLQNDPEGPVQAAARLAIAKLGSASSSTSTTVTPSRPRGPPRFYVAVGRPGTKAPTVTPAMLDRARGFISEEVSAMDGVVLAPDGEKPKEAETQLKRRKLKGFYIEGSITSLEDKNDGTRASVSLILATYPGRDIRAMVRGAVTVVGTRGAEQQAVEGALRSALRKLPQAMGSSNAP